MAFKDKSAFELLTLSEVKRYSEYAGVLNDDTVLIDLDDEKQADVLFQIVKALGVKCKIIKTTRGMHFLFKTASPMQNRTHCKLAIGLTADIKGGGRASYQVLKFDGKEREVLYDTIEYDIIPKFLTPIKTNINYIFSIKMAVIALGIVF